MQAPGGQKNRGINVVLVPGMKKSVPSPARLLQWFFRRGSETLVCALSFYGGRNYGVFVASSDRSSETCELFHSSLEAFRRHARLAHALRSQGWQVVGHSRRDTSRTRLAA